MKFGIREIANVVFKAKNDVKIGNTTFKAGQPVLYIDSAKTSTLEGASTTVYATGGRGNTRLISWEGEKTLTFTVEDALLSPIGFSILSGAGLIKNSTETVHVHLTSNAIVANGQIDLSTALDSGESIDSTAPIYIAETESDGSLTGTTITHTAASAQALTVPSTANGKTVFVDFYITKNGANVSELQIDAENFAGYYYVEASTLVRDTNGKDLPYEITLPNVKIQSSFTFSMAATGDPSTFTFTMDAMPGYTYFDQSRKVLCVMQLVEDAKINEKNIDSVMQHPGDAESV